jgi:hypothetical protein
MGEVRQGREDVRDQHRSERPPIDHIDTQIVHILGKSPIETARSTPQTLNTSPSGVLNDLHRVLGLNSFHPRWVPHFLTDNLRLKRKQVAREMSPYLEAASRDGWQYSIIVDKSWFFLDQCPHRM